jgi:hypothetical protein
MNTIAGTSLHREYRPVEPPESGAYSFPASPRNLPRPMRVIPATMCAMRRSCPVLVLVEGGEVVLPNSQAVISYSNGFHRYSEKDYAERRPYYEELHITNLAPDLPAPMSSRDYFSGRDPALEVIEAHKQ